MANAAIIGRKIGMTRYFDEAGNNVPVTIIQVDPCYVSQVKTMEHDGYSAVQVATGDIKARRSTFQVMGHDAKAGLTPKRFHRELPLDAQALGLEAGKELTVEIFEGVPFVDVTGTSKGKGYAGTMKRYNFKGQIATHGVERKHRSPGSIGGHGSVAGKSGRIKKGKRMSGHMGHERVTVRSLPLVAVDKENRLLLVKGAVPGAKQGLLIVQEAKRLYKRKVNMLKQAS